MTGWLIATELFGEHGSGLSVILSPHCSKTYNRKFNLALVQNLMEMSEQDLHPQQMPQERPNPQASQMTCLEA